MCMAAIASPTWGGYYVVGGSGYGHGHHHGHGGHGHGGYGHGGYGHGGYGHGHGKFFILKEYCTLISYYPLKSI